MYRWMTTEWILIMKDPFGNECRFRYGNPASALLDMLKLVKEEGYSYVDNMAYEDYKNLGQQKLF